MAYQQITFLVNEQIAEALSDSLVQHGALSVAIEDAYAGTDEEQAIFGEPGMQVEQIWQHSMMIALFDESADIDAILTTTANIVRIAPPHYQREMIPEQDWVRLTQSQFDPIHISDRLHITPSWHPVPEQPNIINLQLDPGLAFGTGSHPTTHLCLKWLDQHIKGGETVLDYGCGSGILAIAAIKLGAKSAVGVDIDPQAIRASCENAIQNNVSIKFCSPEELPEGQFDIVIANILANPLRLLAGMLAGRCHAGGQIILSGILLEQQEELSHIYAEWFTLTSFEDENGWVCMHGIRKAN